MAKPTSSSPRRALLQPAVVAMAFVLAILTFHWSNNAYSDLPYKEKTYSNLDSEKTYSEKADTERRIWVSMSVCWSGNTQFYNKKYFPYKLAAELSAKLWRNLTDHAIVVQVIYNELDEGSPKLTTYLDELQATGARVEAVSVDSGIMECSLKAQLQRMFAFRLPYVRPADLVVTADVDTFVMDPDIFADLKRPGYRVWVLQYDEVLNFGFTFNMNFIGMEAQLWRTLLAVSTPEELVEKWKVPLQLKDGIARWDYDQTIVTRILLESGLCSAPADNALWAYIKMKAPKEPANDTEVCFHGMKKWSDCNVKRKWIPGGCKRWHFHVYERKTVISRKYEEILASQRKSTAKTRQ